MIEAAAFGLACGFLALGAGIGVVAALRRLGPSATPAPVLGLLVAAGALAGVALVKRVPLAVVAGAALVAAAGAIPRTRPWWDAAGVAAIVPGATVVAYGSGLRGPAWIEPVVAASIVAGGWAIADLDRRAATARLGLGPVLVAVTAAGIFATTPDTERALVLLLVAAVTAVLAWPVAFAVLGRPGAFATAAVGCWIVAVEGRGRTGAIAGGLACAGLLFAEPVGRLVVRSAGGAVARAAVVLRRPPLTVVAVAVLHAGVVVVASRVAGFEASAGGALRIAGPLLGAATMVAAAVAWTDRSGAAARPGQEKT